MKKRQGAVDVEPFSALFFIASRLLTRVISNLALQAIEKVPDVSQNSARWCAIIGLIPVFKYEQSYIVLLKLTAKFVL